MINADRLLNRFLELVRIDSITYEEKNVVNYLLEVLKPLAEKGITVRVDDAGTVIGGTVGNMIISVPGDANKPPILFNAHLDTVEPGRNIQPEIKDGVITSANNTILGADDKVGVASLLEMVFKLCESESPHGAVEVILTVAEEKGLLGAKNLDFSTVVSKQAFVFDSASPVGHITVQAPFQNSIDVTYLGKATHAGVNPESGVSAIVGASKAIAHMQLGRIDNETTANVGVIKGGRASNIIPDEVEIKAEARSLDETKLETQTKAMTDIFEHEAREIGARIGIEVVREYDGFSLIADDPVVNQAMAASRSIGIEPVLESTGGGSDTNVFNSRGLAAVGLGVGYIQPHSNQETISVDQLEKAAQLALAIATITAK